MAFMKLYFHTIRSQIDTISFIFQCIYACETISHYSGMVTSPAQVKKETGHTHIHTYMSSLESPINLTCMWVCSLGSSWKTTYSGNYDLDIDGNTYYKLDSLETGNYAEMT